MDVVGAVDESVVYKVRNISKTYRTPEGDSTVLSISKLDIPKNKIVIILGYSGSGKSTLVNLLGGLDSPDPDYKKEYGRSGEPPQLTVTVRGNSINLARADSRTLRLLRKDLGFIFQDGYLISNLTNAQNLSLAPWINEIDIKQDTIKKAAEVVGLKAEEINRRPTFVSGGQAQRVSVVRAWLRSPSILLADEPTSRVDVNTAKIIVDLVKEWHTRQIETGNSVSIVWVTHNIDLGINVGDAFLVLRDGEPVDDIILKPSNWDSLAGKDRERFRLKLLEMMKVEQTVSPVDEPISDFVAHAVVSQKGLRKLIWSMIIGDIAPPHQPSEPAMWFERLLRRRFPYFLSFVSLLLLLVLSATVVSLGTFFERGLIEQINDRHFAGIRIDQLKDSQSPLFKENLTAIANLVRTETGLEPISTSPNGKEVSSQRRVVKKVDKVYYDVAYYERYPHHHQELGQPRLVTVDLAALAYDARDPRLGTIPVVYVPGEGVPEGPMFINDRLAELEPIVEKRNNQLGIFIDKCALSDELKYTLYWIEGCRNSRSLYDLEDVPEQIETPLKLVRFSGVASESSLDFTRYGTRGLHADSHNKVREIDVPILGVVEGLPPYMPIIIMQGVFEDQWREWGLGNGLRPDSVTIYPKDLIRDGLEILEYVASKYGWGVDEEIAKHKRLVPLISSTRQYSVFIVVGVLVISIFSLFTAFASSIQQKRREIGVLLAFGLGKRSIFAVFLGQAFALWVAAALLSFAVVMGIIRWIEEPVERLFDGKLAPDVIAQILEVPWDRICLLFAITLVFAFGSVALALRGELRRRPSDLLRVDD